MASKVGAFLQRTLWGTLLAMFLIFMFHFFSQGASFPYTGVKAVFIPLWIVILVNVIFQGLLWLDRRLDRSIPWFHFPAKRLITEVAIAFPVSLGLMGMNFLFLNRLSDVHTELMSHERFVYSYIILMIVIGIAVSTVIAANFFRNWRESLLEVEQLKREKMKSDYRALQDQLNPHFLFNNFNMLLSEIRRDPENAVKITETLADVYRYVLESKNHDTAELRDEMVFVESIIFLHQVRFGDSLVVVVDVPPTALVRRVPPLTLQILLENALKHNVVSASSPLRIGIAVEGNFLAVSNSVKPRTSTYSTGLGLKNVKMRYAYLTSRKVVVKADDTNFTVRVPLLGGDE